MKIFTIGFTKKSAEEFFACLNRPNLLRIIDIRLHNSSQLAGFTKKNDLKFFLNIISNIGYVHWPQLAPTKQILDAYKKNGGDWDTYEKQFLSLIAERKVENTINKDLLDGGCLLCAEVSPEHCHRRLVAEYFQTKWNDIEIFHL